MVATFPYLQPLSHCHFVTIPLALMTSPFTQTSLTWQNSSTKFDKSEVCLKIWNCWKLTPSWKNPYHWKSFGVRDPRDSEAPHPLWYEADRGDLLFLAKGSQTTPRIFCLSLSEMIQVLSLGSWIYPTAMWYSFLDDFLRKIRVLRDFLEYIVLVFHFTEKSECWSTLTCWYSLMVKNLVCGISPAFEFEILPY